MRAGRAADIAPLLDLWPREVTAAVDLYRKLGFEFAFEDEVWEATYP